MTVNQYYSGYAIQEEQDLTDQLIIEAIQMKGLDVKYLPRTHNDYNFLYGEDPTSSFNSAHTIEMYVLSVDGFGEGELMSKFGLTIKDTATFIVNKTRFKEVFPDKIRPNEGDLIFMPHTNAILEIKFVNHESPFFQQGKQFVYELKLETFEMSHEEIQTGDIDLDNLLNSVYPDDPEIETEVFGDNKDFEEDFESSTEFDPNNPFKGTT
jgi:hypothetical protein